ncbi:hypothetical protein GCM10009720_00020 [Yaniella flava]|uniref:Plasmid maintenance system killer protein n=1 Tax=Yaniella flava TaxID=287930 RepID=A0ABP5FHY3_9MICC
MQITFATPEIEKLCTDAKYQRRKLSQDEAKGVQRRYNQLRGAETVGELAHQPGKWHPLVGDRAGEYGGHVTRNKRMVIRGVDEAGLNKQWNECRAIEILEVNFDYHGKGGRR